MEEDERYLGGFYSPSLLAQNTEQAGAGMYATNKKLVLTPKGTNLDKEFNALVTGFWRKDFLPSTLTDDQNHALVRELSAGSPNLLVVRKDNILALEMSRTPGIFSDGSLKIILTSGESIRLIIGRKNEYRYIFSLLQLFNPQALKELYY